jgi:P-type Cu2+ transporter
MLATFVSVDHSFEMRARGGASDSIRAAPRYLAAQRGGPPRRRVEVATAEIQVGDVLLIRSRREDLG